ncbi:MAG TPA: hypothetical protein EYG57_16790 [Planctomycetes bacterium]|nr:hypothetical protein [Planctomycetaceae bacterium]HIM31193.1 hypothetical protein [Planctomycetota bacterium]
MSADENDLTPGQWYWIRKPNGATAPYIFHHLKKDPCTNAWVGVFHVGSMLVTFPLNLVVGEARMPDEGPVRR